MVSFACLCTTNLPSFCITLLPTQTHRFVPPFISSPNTNPLFEISPDGTVFNFVVFGFGFDSVSGDYKVLRMIERCNDYGLLHGETSVYSLKNDSWKSVNDPKKGLVIQNSMGAFVNDVLHFIVIDDYLKPKVKCFNLQTEKFSFLDLPKFDDKFSRNCYVIRELGGCLSMMVNYQNVYLGSVGDRTLGKADLWVMKEYGNKESWFRLFSIRDPAKLDVLTHLRPVVYSRDKERVLLELDNMSYGWYSWGSKYFESIIVHGGPFAFAPYETWTFVDSLVPIGKDKDKDASKAKIVPKKIKNKVNKDDFLSSGFKLKL